MYAQFDLEIPRTLGTALEILAHNDNPKTTPLAGGTNLIVDIRAKRECPERIVALGNIDELRGLECDEERICVGARATVSELLASAEISSTAPSLNAAAKIFAGQMVRNTATVGGNLACGSPAADLVPPLMSLDAEVTLVSKAHTRVVPLEDYYLGYKQDVRRTNELITKISWPRLAENSANSFYKLARRAGDAITVTSVAVTLSVEDGACSKARIALGAVSPTVVRAKSAETLLVGKALTPALIDAAAAQAVDECSPVDDVRASAEYRRHVIEALTRRLLLQGWQAVH